MSGEVPSGWTLRPLLEVVELPSGQIDPRVEPYRSMTLIAPDHLESATGRLLGSQTAAEQGASSGKYLFARGDVVYSKIRPYLRKAYLASDGGICSADMYPLRPTAQVSSSFLLSALLGEHFSAFAATVSQRSGIPKVNREELAEYKLRLPPLPEQRRIAEILDTLDEAIRKTEQVIAKLQQMKQGLLHDLLTRGIDENGELRDPLRHPEQFKDSPLGRIPKEWEVESLERLTARRIVDGVHHTPTYIPEGVPFVTVENLTRGPGVSLTPCRYVSLRAHREYFRRADPRPGDVLVSKDGTLGVARVVPNDLPEFSIFVSVALLRPDRERALPDLLCEFFDTDFYRRQLSAQSAGTGLQHIHLEHFRSFQLPLPNIAEQSRIFAILNGHKTKYQQAQAELSKLRLLKQGLMDDLLTGRVRVKVTEAAE